MMEEAMRAASTGGGVTLFKNPGVPRESRLVAQLAIVLE